MYILQNSPKGWDKDKVGKCSKINFHPNFFFQFFRTDYGLKVYISQKDCKPF